MAVNVRLVPAALRPAGAEGAVAFGYRARGVVLIFEDVFAEVLEHIAAGRLTVGWWNQLLEHERDFHLLRDEDTGQRHDDDADPIARDLVVARARARDDVVLRLVVAPERPSDLTEQDRWLPGLDTPGLPDTAFTGPKIGVLAEAMAALSVGGVLFIQTGARVAPHLPEITDTLRRLGAGSIEMTIRPHRIIVVKVTRIADLVST